MSTATSDSVGVGPMELSLGAAGGRFGQTLLQVPLRAVS